MSSVATASVTTTPSTVEVLERLLQVHRNADEQRLCEMDEARDESVKWKAEGDMYGWNFHEGKASGMTQASIIFFRVRREIEKYLKQLRPPTQGT